MPAAGPRDSRPVVSEPPRIPVNLVGRTPLFRRLDRMAPVTVLEALPGFGKTTVVAEWARSKRASGAAVVWLRITRELDDVAVFLAGLHEGLVRADAVRQAVPAPRNAPRQSRRDRLPSWVGDLVLSRTPVVVVVDDAHLASESVVDALLDLTRASSLHVVLCCSTQHPVHEVAARHGLETNVLQGGDLSVAHTDLPAYAAAWGHHLSPDDARRLHDLVGGWLLPLRLVLDATPPSSPAFATHVARDFLVERVLGDLGDDGAMALPTRLAMPEQLDPALVAALLDSAPSDESPPVTADLATTTLERQGLLWRVPRDDGAPVWRFPTLVRRTLLDHLEQTQPQAASAAHGEVARILAARGVGYSGDLLRHARAAGDWALLDRLWSERGWQLAGADPTAFRDAYARIPSAALEELGSLVLAGSLGDALASTAEDSDWMQRVEALLRRYMEAGTDFLRQNRKPQSHHELADMLTAAMIARRTAGHLREAGELALAADKAYARARALDPAQPRASQIAWFQLQHGITLLLSGRYSAALEITTAAYQTSPNSLIGSGAAGLLACMHAISGQARDARHWLGLHEAIDVSGHWAAGLAQLPARVARVMLALDRLDGAAADAELEAIMLGSEASGLWPLVVTVHTRHAMLLGDPMAMLARLDHLTRVLARHLRSASGVGRQVFERCSVELNLALGEVNRVQARLSATDTMPPWLVAPAARFHAMTGETRAALRIASAGAWRSDLHVRDQLQLLVIKALAQRDLGKERESTTSLQRAHALAADTGNLEPYLLLPQHDRVALLRAAGIHLDPTQEELVRRGRQLYPDRADLVQLSPRELEVLRQMRHHDTVAGLARALSVSVNTVKKQLVSLYAKLDVHDRSSALLRAERLGFLDDPGDRTA